MHHTLGETGSRQQYVERMFAHVTAKTVIIDRQDGAVTQIDEAIAAAIQSSKPVYIEIACNLATSFCSRLHPINFFQSDVQNSVALTEAAKAASDLIKEKQNVVILVGAGVKVIYNCTIFCCWWCCVGTVAW
tara:strand:- start:752 stop:1147 length:396 start_codon:yes stop_codon:yes gene_type:complete